MASSIQIRLVNDTATGRLLAQARSVQPAQRIKILRAMGRELKNMAKENVGPGHGHRPLSFQWPRLSERYAKRVGRSHATLFLTEREAIRVGKDSTGKHLRNITQESVNASQVTIQSNVLYAKSHQFGTGYIPVREFFPIKRGGRMLYYAQQRILKAIKLALKNLK